jgi:hypothetical protein
MRLVRLNQALLFIRAQIAILSGRRSLQNLAMHLSPFLGQITGATGDRYDVGNGRFSESLTGADIKGKMIFVIPFLGTIFGWVGL